MAKLEELQKEFPKQFYDKMPCWSEYPPGWHHLIRNVLKRAEAARVPVKWVQIKEKSGGLRMYEQLPEMCDTSIHDWIAEAERLSTQTCQECGNKGRQITINRWVATLCEECYKQRIAN